MSEPSPDLFQHLRAHRERLESLKATYGKIVPIGKAIAKDHPQKERAERDRKEYRKKHQQELDRYPDEQKMLFAKYGVSLSRPPEKTLLAECEAGMAKPGWLDCEFGTFSSCLIHGGQLFLELFRC